MTTWEDDARTSAEPPTPDLEASGDGRLAAVRAALAATARTVRRPASLRGAVREVAWIGAHLALYPTGARRERIAVEDLHSVESLPPGRRGLVIGNVEAAGTPILLIHGLVGNRAIFTLLRRNLHRRGFGTVRTYCYGLSTTDVRTAARSFADAVEALCAETGYERVHVIGHSLGGLVARYYVQRLGGDERVHTLVTMGTPHGGTLAARLAPLKITRQLRPGSELMLELGEPADGLRTRVIAMYSDIDALVLPSQAAALDHPDISSRNVLVRGVGHMSFPIDGRVVHEVVTALAHLDSAGETVRHGIARVRPPSAS